MQTKLLKCLYYAVIMFVMIGCDDEDVGRNIDTYVYNFESEGIRYHILSEKDKTVEVTRRDYGDDDYSGDIVIPQNVAVNGNTYSVTTIGERAFSGCSALTSVSMPAVTTIGNYAFSGCSALTSADMPEVTTIGGYAFYNCSALTSADMPEATTIGPSAFHNCYALTSADMPEATTIGGYAFYNCYALTSDDMPEVTTIGPSAFHNCYALASVSMSSATTIGDWSFSFCVALTSVDIPASVMSIDNSAFMGCISLRSVYCHWKQPVACIPIFEERVLANATLYVPDGCVDAYRSVSPWSKFANIQEGGYSGIAEDSHSALSVKMVDGHNSYRQR